VEEAAVLRWVVVVERNREDLEVQLVARPEQQPYIVDNIGHMPHNHHKLRMGLGH
jgi:hypothetical protein